MTEWSVYDGSHQLVQGVSFDVARNILLDALSFRMDTSGSAFDREVYQAASKAYYEVVANSEPATFREWIGETQYSLQPDSESPN